MRRLLPALCLLLLAAGGDPKPAIENLRAHRQDGSLIVSFELTEVFDQPTIERVESGLPVEFRYVVRLERSRRMWFNRSLERTTLDIAATYNAVTSPKEYRVYPFAGHGVWREHGETKNVWMAKMLGVEATGL